jgi:queuine tRNA-ribosyltransferase
MVFDECTPYPANEEMARISMEMSLRWAERSKQAHEGSSNALFGIVQGGMYEDLRSESAEKLQRLNFDGYAIGGLSVGEPKGDMLRIMTHTAALLPVDKPRYLMGVALPKTYSMLSGKEWICLTACYPQEMPEMVTYTLRKEL